METALLHPFQAEAIDAIQKALDRKQKNIVVEIPTGYGIESVIVKIVEILTAQKAASVLVITERLEIKRQLENRLIKANQEFVKTNKCGVTIETGQRILKNEKLKTVEYQFIVFYNVVSEIIYETFSCKAKTVISIGSNCYNYLGRFFSQNEVVFSYSFADAVKDGYLTPAMDARAWEPAFVVFAKQLLEQFGYVHPDGQPDIQDPMWDFVVEKGSQKIWVDCKIYKSQVVSPSAANSLLKDTIMHKMKQGIPQKDIVLLIVLSNVPSLQKNEIWKRFRIIVWDIDNLVFYSSNGGPALLKRLSQITYFPIDYIEGCPSEEAEQAGLILETPRIVYEIEADSPETNDLLQQLKACKPGKNHSGEYEDICEKIIRTLFEASYFNRLTRQHKTNDERFRMDLIGTLKINQANDEGMHPLWKMLVQHYNSHFVVFEFKNYSKKIDQNLIYITEKYLYDAALRNVTFIISRKGFSQSARFAAEGCLKEHGKLILDITDEDLVKMLESKNDNAADYLYGKLEDYLMGISK